MELTNEQFDKLAKSRNISGDLRIERYRQTRKNQRLARLQGILVEQSKLLPLSGKELFLAGLFLYWGEGSKQHGSVYISNTNPSVLKFALFWMVESLGIPREKIKAQLHLYKDMEIVDSVNYWSEELGLPRSQFNRPYIKKTNRIGLTYKSFGHGTCNIGCYDVVISEKLAMSVKAISEYYGAKSGLFWYN